MIVHHQFEHGFKMQTAWLATTYNLHRNDNMPMLRKAEDAMEDMLKQSGDARKLAVSLKHLNYGESLVDQLFKHSTDMEKLYGVVQGLSAKKAPEESYQKCLQTFESSSSWFEKAKAG